MNNSPLEFLAKKYGNVVKYDADGNVAGIFVKFPKMKSSDLVAGLPEHTHPAFIINGVEQDYILLGKYKGGENGVSGGALVSLPNINPARTLGADQCLSRMKLAGPGITGMTCADYGFIKLLAQKNGWKPHGNTAWGQAHQDASAWETGKALSVNTERAYNGYIYKCLIAHTTAAELRPDLAPTYWEKGKFVGGISNDGTPDAAHQTGYRTLNGTGPLDWYLGSDPALLADIIGSSLEQQYGYRIVDCELQILENNNAADPDADLSASSAAWRAILPNTSDNGYTLPDRGREGRKFQHGCGEHHAPALCAEHRLRAGPYQDRRGRRYPRLLLRQLRGRRALPPSRRQLHQRQLRGAWLCLCRRRARPRRQRLWVPPPLPLNPWKLNTEPLTGAAR